MLAPGDAAPDFTRKDQHGRSVTLSSFAGTRNVLLVFFPLAFTPICQGELELIRDNPQRFSNAETVTFAIAASPPPVHKVWAGQHGFTFGLLSDFWPHGAVAQAYGVFNAHSGLADRGTFVIDKSGVIRFAECKEPGEVRDQTVWTAALDALG